MTFRLVERYDEERKMDEVLVYDGDNHIISMQMRPLRVYQNPADNYQDSLVPMLVTVSIGSMLCTYPTTTHEQAAYEAALFLTRKLTPSCLFATLADPSLVTSWENMTSHIAPQLNYSPLITGQEAYDMVMKWSGFKQRFADQHFALFIHNDYIDIYNSDWVDTTKELRK